MVSDPGPMSALTDGYHHRTVLTPTSPLPIFTPLTPTERKEATCRATAERRNRNRTTNTRTRIGPRLDAVIRTVEDDTHEYGGMEVARSYSGQTSSKWLGDTFKLAKALRDMLHRLHVRVEHDEKVARKLQVVGVFCAGVKIQTVRLGCWKGGVAVLIKDPVMEVPVAIEGMTGLCKVIAGVQRIKVCQPFFEEGYSTDGGG